MQPGIVRENTFIKNNSAKTQTAFIKSNNFIIQDGELNIALYPSFKAGTDTITINIPGIDPINIPVIVNPGDAKKVLLTLQRTSLNLTEATETQGTINIVDTRNNKVTKPTTVKIGVIGAADINDNEFIYNGTEYMYTIAAKKPGGE